MVAFVAIISIASCKKEIDYSDPNGNGCQLKSWKVTNGSGELALNFEYDVIGRVIKETSSEGTYTRVFTTNKITATDDEGSIDELVLSNGRALSSGTDGIMTNGIVSFEYTKRYDYNAEGYLKEIKSYQNNNLTATNVLTYADGNLVKSVLTDLLTGDINTTTFSYGNEKAVGTSYASDQLYTMVDYQTGNYFGKASKNIMVSTSDIASDPDGNPKITSASAYSYKFDAKGNATGINITDTTIFYTEGVAGPAETSVNKYEQTFTCK